MGVARLPEEFAAALTGRTDTPPFADQGAVAKQCGLDREYIVARHVLGRVDSLEEDVEKRHGGPTMLRRPNPPIRHGVGPIDWLNRSDVIDSFC